MAGAREITPLYTALEELRLAGVGGGWGVGRL